MPHYLNQLAHDQIGSLSPDKRLIVLHPRYMHQRTLMHTIMQQGKVVYMAMDASFKDNLCEQLDITIKEQQISVSEHIDAIILDNCDVIPEDMFQQFIEATLSRLSKTRLVMVSRALPGFVSSVENLRQITQFVPVHEPVMLFDYSTLNPQKNFVEVRAFGEGHVNINGKPIRNWDGVLPRNLFFFMIDRGMATRAEIFETFWPDMATREATNVFHVTKRKVNEILGIDLTAYWSGYYRISPEIDLRYDVVQFSELVQHGEITDDVDEAIRSLESALTLYKGSYLPGVHNSWFDYRRHELQLAYLDALVTLSELHQNKQELRPALGYALRALAIDNDREELVKRVMSIYTDLQMIDDALLTYDRYVEHRTRTGHQPGASLAHYALDLREGVSA